MTYRRELVRYPSKHKVYGDRCRANSIFMSGRDEIRNGVLMGSSRYSDGSVAAPRSYRPCRFAYEQLAAIILIDCTSSRGWFAPLSDSVLVRCSPLVGAEPVVPAVVGVPVVDVPPAVDPDDDIDPSQDVLPVT